MMIDDDEDLDDRHHDWQVRTSVVGGAGFKPAPRALIGSDQKHGRA
jgi:hypothetical protein